MFYMVEMSLLLASSWVFLLKRTVKLLTSILFKVVTIELYCILVPLSIILFSLPGHSSLRN